MKKRAMDGMGRMERGRTEDDRSRSLVGGNARRAESSGSVLCLEKKRGKIETALGAGFCRQNERALCLVVRIWILTDME
jgi:hypothetical protein